MTERVPAAKGLSDSTLRRMMPFWMDNLYENLPKIRGGKDIVDIPKREKEPCIVVGAGPSLKYYEHLKMIAESGWKHPVISCDKVLSDCIESGIIPYASASVDASSKIANFYAHKNIRQHAKSIYGIFNSFVSSSVANTWANYGGEPYWFVPELDLPMTKEGFFNPGLSWMLSCLTKHQGVISAIGNVGSFLWNFAGAVLNCSPVILVGFDFSEQIKDKVDAVYFNQYVSMFLKKFDEKTAQDKAAESHQLEDNPDVIAEKTGKGWLENYYEAGKPVRYLVNPIWKEYRNKFALSLAQSGIETLNCTGNGCLHTGAKDDNGNYILKLPNFKVKTLQEVIKEWK
jgi:hypothetical protein